MPDLMCNVSTCEYNKSHLCCKNGITIGGDEAYTSEYTNCKSYEEKSGAFLNTVQSPNPSMDVACEASSCAYNEQWMCKAEVVSVSGGPVSSSAKTECATFVPKY